MDCDEPNIPLPAYAELLYDGTESLDAIIAKLQYLKVQREALNRETLGVQRQAEQILSKRSAVSLPNFSLNVMPPSPLPNSVSGGSSPPFDYTVPYHAPALSVS